MHDGKTTMELITDKLAFNNILFDSKYVKFPEINKVVNIVTTLDA